MIVFACILTASTVCASQNVTDIDTVGISDESNEISTDESDDDLSISEEEGLAENPKTFTDLNNYINSSSESNIYLNHDYKYNKETDSNFANGVVVNRPVNIFGNGHTVDGNGEARIFNLTSENIFLRDINFINAYADDGAAIIGENYGAISCNFTDNVAIRYGGAMIRGHAEDCIFKYNTARSGGAMYDGSATDCIFISNNARFGGAVYDVYCVNSTFIENYASSSSGAMNLNSAIGCTFIRNSAKELSGAAGKAYVLDCIFINNTASLSGAIGDESSGVNCIFTGNSANEGGAIYSCYIVNSTFKSNHAQRGGAIFSGSAVDCIFDNNYAQEEGGAIFNVYVENCNFTANTAREGGAMYLNSAVGCNFINNSAKESAGALKGGHAVDCTFINNSAVTAGAISDGSATDCTFQGNSAREGGALADSSSAMGCTFISNYATEGGALYSSSAVDCTFIENHAMKGGAIAANSSAIDSSFINNAAIISGGANYQSSVINCYLKGNTPKYKLYVSNFEAVYGFGGELKVKLADSLDTPVTGVSILVKIYNSRNVLYETYTCLSGYNLFVDLPAGEYKAVVSVNDTAYNTDPVSISITIKKATSIYVQSVSTVYNGWKYLTVNLHDSSGNIIKYVPISITLNGATNVYRTNSNGQILVLTNGLAPKTYSVKISYAGSDVYTKSEATAKIVVKKANPKMTYNIKKYKAKVKSKVYTVSLRTNEKLYMKNTKVYLTVGGKRYTAKTNGVGVATFKITKLTKKGNYRATIYYAGSKYYNAITRSVVITVKR